jgi:hypothetical protein
MLGVTGTTIWMFAAIGMASQEEASKPEPAGLIQHAQ